MENRHCCIRMFHVFMVAIICLSGTCQLLGEHLLERQVIGGIEAVRLVDGQSSQFGRLEVFIGGVWGTVCDDGFNSDAANVACRSLGFQGSNLEVSLITRPYPVTDYTTPILLDDVRCIGNESSLNECRHRPIGDHNCNHVEDVGVGCVIGGIAAMRLVDGPSSQIGRLEVFIGGVWGTVCNDHFFSNAAKVVCRSLGFQGSNLEVGSFTGHYPVTDYTTPILLDDVSCIGNESSLNECRHNPFGNHDCEHREDVGVGCEPLPTVDQVRLVNGSNLHEGRVEVLVNGTWGTVCDDYFSNATASVVCRMLGFEPVGAEAIPYAPFGRGTGPILLDDVRCNGDETTLSDCVFVTRENCGHYEDLGVRCG